MRKFLGLLFLCIFSLAIVGCDKDPDPNDNDDDDDDTNEEVGTITWAGLEDAVVIRGDIVELLDGVTASDSIDGDITDSIEIEDDDDFTSSLAGGYVITYTVTNSTGVTETKTKNFTVRVGHNVANGDFDLANYGWRLDIPGGNATLKYENSQGVVTISNSGTAWWSVQLYQNNIIFEENQTYKLTLKAKSPDGRSISAGFEDVDNGYSMMNPGFCAMELTDSMQEYSIYYTANSSYANVKVVVYLGYQLDSDIVTGENHTVIIDDIYIEKVDAAQNVTFTGVESIDVYSGDINFDPLTGVSATDGSGNNVTSNIDVFGDLPENVQVPSTYYLSYRVTLDDGSFSFVNRKVNVALQKDYEYQAVNGKFDNGLTGWNQDVNQTNGDGAATFSNNGDGTVSINVTSVSDAGWHIQLQQANSTFREGETYVVRIILKSDVARKVTIEVVDPGNGFAAIAPALNAVEVGTDWTKYEIEFTADKDYSGAKIGLLLGNVDGMQVDNTTVTVDEFQVYKYDPFNEDFDTTNSPWAYDRISGEVVNGEVVVTFVDGSSEGSKIGVNPWDNQLYQSSGSELVAGHTYKVEVYLKASIDRNIKVWIEDAARGYSAIANGENTTFALTADQYQLCSYEVTITDDLKTNNAKFVVMFGDSAIENVAHTVTIDYFRVTDVTNTQ